jgi:hypothetical protein
MTNGQSGELPEGYIEAKAALFWGIDPNTVIHWPVFWVDLGFAINEAESNARKKKDSLAAKKANRNRGKRSR